MCGVACLFNLVPHWTLTSSHLCNVCDNCAFVCPAMFLAPLLLNAWFKSHSWACWSHSFFVFLVRFSFRVCNFISLILHVWLTFFVLTVLQTCVWNQNCGLSLSVYEEICVSAWVCLEGSGYAVTFMGLCVCVFAPRLVIWSALKSGPSSFLALSAPSLTSLQYLFCPFTAFSHLSLILPSPFLHLNPNLVNL